MNSIVISLGGSVLISDDVDSTYFQKLTKFLKELSEQYKIYIIVGGGKTARTYINLGRKLNFNEETLDTFGIDITRVNARILTNLLNISNEKIPESTDEALEINKQLVIMGGTTPGHSTDMVGAELAEKIDAKKFIIATNVDGVYDKDPNKYSDAKQLKEISIEKLIDEYGTEWSSAGKNIVIDGPSLKILKRAKIPTYVLNGKKLEELKKVINNEDFNGTIIKI
ncbi:MAG: UMP kinase [Thermoplasmatales archaeon]|nr:MAG: UMP kinase [Thermoplasmatales archaeon]